jgi:hypothetical protein
MHVQTEFPISPAASDPDIHRVGCGIDPWKAIGPSIFAVPFALICKES